MKKNIAILGFLMLLIVSTAAAGALLEKAGAEEFAPTPLYTASFSYSVDFHAIGVNGSETVERVTSGSNVTEASCRYDYSQTGKVSMILYGGSTTSYVSYQSTATFISGNVLNIVFSSPYEVNRVTIYDSLMNTAGIGEGTTLTFGGLSSGEYSICVEMTGSPFVYAGGHAFYSATVTASVKIDCGFPEIFSEKAADGAVTVSAVDDYSGINRIYIKKPTSSSYISYSTSYKITANAAEGIYLAYARDLAGNIGPVQEIFIDRRPPDISLLSWYGADITYLCDCLEEKFTVQCYEEGSGLESLTVCRLNDGIILENPYSFVEEDGEYLITAVDKAGNETSMYVVLDINGPAVCKIIGEIESENDCANGPVTFIGTGNVPVVSYSLFRNGEPVSVESNEYPDEGICVSEDGDYEFYVIDAAGKISQPVSVTIDTVSPSLSVYAGVAQAGGDGFFHGSVKTYSSEDGVSIYFSKNGEEYRRFTGQTLADGYYSFKAVDYAGNESDYVSFYMDNTIPSGMVLKDGTPVSGSSGGTVSYHASDGFSGIMGIFVSIDGAPFMETTNNSEFSQSGRYIFYCSDIAGNVSEMVSFVLDNDPPILMTTSSGTASGEFKVTGTDQSPFTVYCKKPGRTNFVSMGSSVTISESEVDGEYYFYGVDGFNNSSEIIVVTLSVPGPSFDIIHNEKYTAAYVCFDEGICILDGENYTSGALVTICGSHTGILNGRNGRSSAIVFSIEHDYEDTVIQSTCTGGGYTRHTCVKCENYYDDEVTGISGHSFGEWETDSEPLCTKAGTSIHRCIICGYEEYEAIPILGHNYILEVVNSTCTERGYFLHICSRCGDSYKTDYSSILGHNYTIEENVNVTCYANGCIRHICERCGDSYETDIIYSTGHVYEVVSVAAATCTETGERVFRCIHCYESIMETIQPYGHTYILVSESESGGKISSAYRCITCGTGYEVEMMSGISEILERTKNVFSFSGPYLFIILGSACGIWGIVLGIMIVFAKRSDDVKKARKLLYAFVIGLVGIAVIVMAVPLLLDGIAAILS